MFTEPLFSIFLTFADFLMRQSRDLVLPLKLSIAEFKSNGICFRNIYSLYKGSRKK